MCVLDVVNHMDQVIHVHVYIIYIIPGVHNPRGYELLIIPYSAYISWVKIFANSFFRKFR